MHYSLIYFVIHSIIQLLNTKCLFFILLTGKGGGYGHGGYGGKDGYGNGGNGGAGTDRRIPSLINFC